VLILDSRFKEEVTALSIVAGQKGEKGKRRNAKLRKIIVAGFVNFLCRKGDRLISILKAEGGRKEGEFNANDEKKTWQLFRLCLSYVEFWTDQREDVWSSDRSNVGKKGQMFLIGNSPPQGRRRSLSGSLSIS